MEPEIINLIENFQKFPVLYDKSHFNTSIKSLNYVDECIQVNDYIQK